MAIHQTKKQSDLEKRLQLLRRQVYGKDQHINYQSRKLSINQGEFVTRSTTNPVDNQPIDLIYLHQDLLKILLFSSLAIGAQVILFILAQKHILNLSF